MLAGRIIRHIGDKLEVPTFLEVTVEDSKLLDMAEFVRCPPTDLHTLSPEP